MTEFEKKSFSVYPGKDGGQVYRDNWDAVFGKKERPQTVPYVCDQCGLSEDDDQSPCSCEWPSTVDL